MADMIFAHCSLGCAETTRQQVFFDQVEENSPKQQNNKTTKQQDHKTLFHHLHTPPSIRKNEDVNTLLQGFEPPSIG